MKDRNLTLDFFRLISAWLIVSLHTVDILEKIPNFMILIESIGRIGVPFFFTLTGFMLKKKNAFDNSEYIFKYILKILKEFFIWCGMYLVFLNIIQILKYIKFKDSINLIYPGKYFWYYGYGIYWYLIAIIWAILIYKILLKVMKPKTVFILSILLFVASFFGRGQIFSNENFDFQTRDALFMGFPYLYLGIFLASKRETIKKINISKFILALALLLNIFLIYKHLKYIYNIELNKPTDIFPLVYINIIIIFIYSIKNPLRFNFYFVKKFSKYSAGIYFIHIFYIKISLYFFKNNLVNLIEKNFIFAVIYISLIFLLSLYSYIIYFKILDKLLQKQKIFKKEYAK